MSGAPGAKFRLVALALLCSMASGACKDDELVPATQVLVTVDSDLEVGTQLTRIEFFVKDSSGTPRKVPRDFNIVTANPTRARDEVVLPFSFGVVKGDDSEFQLVATGFRPGPGEDEDKTFSIEQTFNATFADRKTMKLSVFLGALCYEVECPSNSETCYPRDRGGVSASQCGDIPDAVLTPVKPGEELPEAGSGERDAGEAVDGGDAGDPEAGAGGAGAGGAGAGGAGAGGTNAGTGGAAGGCSVALTTYYEDLDGDGHGDLGVSQQACGTAPSGYVTSSDDCCDSDDRAYPGQTEPFTTAVTCVGGAFDFNCDGTDEKSWELNAAGTCCGYISGSPAWTNGWLGNTIPECGETRDFNFCDPNMCSTCSGQSCSANMVEPLIQDCL